MSNPVPKPGPHLHLPQISADPPPKLPFRELAKHHARAAAELVSDADHAHATGMADWGDLLDLATAHAEVSLACSAIAPPSRRPFVQCTQAAK